MTSRLPAPPGRRRPAPIDRSSAHRPRTPRRRSRRGLRPPSSPLAAGKPLVFSEFDADARAGFHDPANKQKFSKEFQTDYYRATLDMASRLPTLRGMSPWILKDFRLPRRQNPDFQQGWNRKVLISETGQRKAAFDVLATYYEHMPVHGK